MANLINMHQGSFQWQVLRLLQVFFYWGFSSSHSLNASHSQTLNSVCSLVFCLCRICLQDKNHYFKLCTFILINAGLTESNQRRQLHVLLLGFQYKTLFPYYQTLRGALEVPPPFLAFPGLHVLPATQLQDMELVMGEQLGFSGAIWLFEYLEERPFLYHRHKGVCLTADPRKWVSSTWDYFIVWVFLLL